MKVLVTGANGYLGQGIVRTLLDRGVSVIASDLQCDRIDKRAQILEGSFFDIPNPYEFYGKPDVVLHLAWRDGFKHESEKHMEDLPKHYFFLKRLSECGIKRICVMGSMHEVGFYEGGIDESTPTKPLSLYGVAKNALRQAIEIEAKKNGNKFQWIRGFYIVGNAEQGCSVFSKIAQTATAGGKEFPFTSGQNQFDFIDYEEFCKQVTAVVMQDKVLGVINCCSGHPMKLAERVERFIGENGYDIKLLYGTFPDRPYDSKAIWGNDAKIRRILEENE